MLAPKSNPRCQGLTLSSRKEESTMTNLKVPSRRCVPLYVSALSDGAPTHTSLKSRIVYLPSLRPYVGWQERLG